MLIKTESKKLNILIITAIGVFPLLYVIQGIDFTDTGWALTFFQQIFNDPSCITYWFHLWLTNIIGGIWNFFFGWGGLLSFKIAACLISWVIAFFIYRIYRDYFENKTFLLLALFFGLVFYYSARITVIYYNNVSMLLLSLAALLLTKGIDKNKRALLFCAGSAIALTAFARISNVLSLSFVLVILFDAIIEKKRFFQLFLDCAFVFIGFLAASAFVFMIMAALGHLDIYLNSVKELFLNPSSSNYSLKTIIRRFLTDLRGAFTYGVCLLITVIFAAFLGTKIKPLLYKALSLVFALAVFLFTYNMTFNIRSFINMSIGIIAITCILIITLAGNEHKKQKELALLTVLLISVLSVGSDTGITVGSYGIIFGFPLIFWFLNEMPSLFVDVITRKEAEGGRKLIIPLDYSNKRKMLIFLVCIYIALSVPLLFRYIYRDSSERWKMNTLVSHNMLNGVFTTPERAAVIESLIQELNKYVKENDYLLTYDAVSMIYYLTKTRPYLYNSWPSLYSQSELQNSLNKALNEHEYLPVVVLAKVLIITGSWPNSGVNNLDRPEKNRPILFNFLEENEYQVVWENSAFRILLPGQSF